MFFYRQSKLEKTVSAVRQLDTGMKNLNLWMSYVENVLNEEISVEGTALEEVQTKLQENQVHVRIFLLIYILHLRIFSSYDSLLHTSFIFSHYIVSYFLKLNLSSFFLTVKPNDNVRHKILYLKIVFK